MRLRRQPKEILVLTLLVKNEVDFIVDNIFFHYAKGVDHIVVCDNGSTDGTLEILKEMQQDGLIELIEESLYHQDRIVNKMGQIATDKFGATILIHADADEFWTPVNQGNLKKEFLKLKVPSVLVDRKDALPLPEYRDQPFPQKKMNIVQWHLESDDIEKDSQKTSLFLFRLPPKVMFSVKDGFKFVGFGNHLLASGDSGEVTDKMIIYHFPFKSTKRFEDKVIMAGDFIKSVKTAKSMSWHWKRWWKQYQQGKLEEAINILVPDLTGVPGIRYKSFDYTQRVTKIILGNRKYRRLYQKYKDKTSSLAV